MINVIGQNYKHIILNNIETFGDCCINASLSNERQSCDHEKSRDLHNDTIEFDITILFYILYGKKINI
jgi:hypothetical protein